MDPPIFNVIDEDAGGGDGGDGSVQDLRRSKSRVACLCKGYGVGDLRLEGLDGSVGVVGGSDGDEVGAELRIVNLGVLVL